MSMKTIFAPHAPTIAAMVHDVGKYITRTAVNLESFPPTTPLVDMMIADLYRLDGAKRASAVFETFTDKLPPHPMLDECKARLLAIDALEDDVRAYDRQAVRDAARLALEVRDMLIALREEIGAGHG